MSILFDYIRFANFGIKHGNAQKLVELTGYLLICDVQLT